MSEQANKQRNTYRREGQFKDIPFHDLHTILQQNTRKQLHTTKT